MSSKEEKKIKRFIRGSSLEILKKSILQVISDIQNEHKGLANRIFWLLFFAIIIVVSVSIGGFNAEQTVPTGDWEKRYLNNELFNVEISMKNNNHQSDRLIIETEWIQYNFTISNNYEKDTIFKVRTTVSNSGKSTWIGQYSQLLIPAGKSENVTNLFPVEFAGINIVHTTFEMYSVYESGRNEGKINLAGGSLYEDSLPSTLRAISFSDYLTMTERAFFYKVLWVIVAPFAAITVKHLRDLFENK